MFIIGGTKREVRARKTISIWWKIWNKQQPYHTIQLYWYLKAYSHSHSFSEMCYEFKFFNNSWNLLILDNKCSLNGLTLHYVVEFLKQSIEHEYKLQESVIIYYTALICNFFFCCIASFQLVVNFHLLWMFNNWYNLFFLSIINN